jgi:hypothetical protein
MKTGMMEDWKNGINNRRIERWNYGMVENREWMMKWCGNKGLKQWNHRTKPQPCAVFQSSFQYSNIPFFNRADAKS